MDRDVFNAEYGLLEEGKNKNVNEKLAKQLVKQNKAHPANKTSKKKLEGTEENKSVKPSENK
jgi:hypothetical protein